MIIDTSIPGVISKHMYMYEMHLFLLHVGPLFLFVAAGLFFVFQACGARRGGACAHGARSGPGRAP